MSLLCCVEQHFENTVHYETRSHFAWMNSSTNENSLNHLIFTFLSLNTTGRYEPYSLNIYIYCNYIFFYSFVIVKIFNYLFWLDKVNNLYSANNRPSEVFIN